MSHDFNFSKFRRQPRDKDKPRHVVGMLVISVKIGDHCYHGLCDMGVSVSACVRRY